MHSSRMRTVRSSGRISGGVYLVPGGVYLVPGGCAWSQRGVPGPGGVDVPGFGVYLVLGVHLVPGGVPGRGGDLVRYSPLVDRQTPVKT